MSVDGACERHAMLISIVSKGMNFTTCLPEETL